MISFTCLQELNLINEEVKLDDPQSIHYVFGGMAPISVSLLIRMFEQRGFQAISRVLSLLPGGIINPAPRDEHEFFEPSTINRVKKVLIYFLGGVTYAEVAAIRFLNTHSMFSGRFKFVVATTSIISSEKCMRQMRTAAVNNLDLNSLATQ